jgi:hypothetical protein
MRKYLALGAVTLLLAVPLGTAAAVPDVAVQEPADAE